MKCIRTFPRMFGLVMLLGIAGLALPFTAHAGGFHVSVGLGLPVPVVVAPAPVVVRHPQPVIVQSAPVVVTRPPVIGGEPWVGYERPYYAGYHVGYERPSYRGVHRHWRHWKHHHHNHD